MRDWTVAGLLKRCDDLERALRPMADFAVGFRSRSDSHVIASNALGAITVGDLRRAEAAIEAGEME